MLYMQNITLKLSKTTEKFAITTNNVCNAQAYATIYTCMTK